MLSQNLLYCLSLGLPQMKLRTMSEMIANDSADVQLTINNRCDRGGRHIPIQQKPIFRDTLGRHPHQLNLLACGEDMVIEKQGACRDC